VSFQGKPIQCSACATTFAFSAEEQEFFDPTKGFINQPKHCSPVPPGKEVRTTRKQLVQLSIADFGACTCPAGQFINLKGIC